MPVNFEALRNPRRDSTLVAAAGPSDESCLTTLAAALALHLSSFYRMPPRPWVGENLKSALVINVLLAIFNLRASAAARWWTHRGGSTPDALAKLLARLEPYGLMILIVVLFVLPPLGAQLGIDLNVVWQLVQRSTNVIIDAILWLTGNA